MNPQAVYNPYEPPKGIPDPTADSSLERWQTMVDRFRREMHALAGAAIFLAGLTVLLTTVGLDWLNKTDAIAIVTGLIGAVISIGFFVLGVQIAMKKMKAVRVFMSLAYLMLAAAVFSIPRMDGFSVFCAICLGFTVAQCHGVLSNARHMLAAGIPLNKKPGELFAERLNGSWNPPQQS